MAALEGELDFKYHRGLQPDVYYRCPTSDSLDGALRNEIERSAQSLIPVEICTEFVFGAGSAITLLPTQQPNLDGIGIQPSDLPQLTTVNHALCDGIEGKDRLKIQRAVARCFIETMQSIDGFKYAERQAFNKDGSDGVRFKYVCSDSLQNRDRKNNVKKEQEDSQDAQGKRKRVSSQVLPTYDCGGAIHIKFSLKREAINIVYQHNPIHRDAQSRNANGENESLPALQNISMNQNGSTVETPKKRRKKNEKAQVQVKSYQQDDNDHDDDYVLADLNISPSPEPDRRKTSGKKKGRKSAAPISLRGSRGSKAQQKSKQPQSPSKSRKKVVVEPSPPPQPVKGKACVRCKEKKIKCNEARPACNQCRRGLWTCQYQDAPAKKRSKNGCLNCRQRKRKCTEERPSCAYCLKVDDDCEYAGDNA